MPSIRLASFLVPLLFATAAGAGAEPPAPAVESSDRPAVTRAAPLPRPALTRAVAASGSTTTLGPNLIANPSLETPSASDGSVPDGWFRGGYGSNTATFSYPVTGSGGSGTRAARVTISHYSSGDAKWFFADVPVSGDATYQYSDLSIANVPTVVVLRFTLSGGGYAYVDLLGVAASTTFHRNVARFTAPTDAVALTVFHVIAQVGSLTTDDHALNLVTRIASTQNLLPTGDFETAAADGEPAHWQRRVVGTSTPTFGYPVAGTTGSAAQVGVSAYASGRAGWLSDPIALPPGLYRYADAYRSDQRSLGTLKFVDAAGRVMSRNFGAPARPAWGSTSFGFTVPVTAQATTVMRSLGGDGSLTLDDAAILSQSAFDAGAVTFRFDDGKASQYAVAARKLDSRGFSGTFYIITHRTREGGYLGYMSIADIQDLARRGHEIGAHTRTHVHLSGLTAKQRSDEIAGSRQDLLGWDVGPALSFAYPFGDYDLATIQAARDAGFTSAAATLSGSVGFDADPYQLQQEEVNAGTSLDVVKGWIDAAATERRWLILTFHGIDKSGDYYSVTPTMFGAIVDYVKSRHLPVVTASQAIGSLRE